MSESIPIGLCGCGCGGATNVANRNRTKRGHIIGQPYRYIKGHQNQKPSATEKQCRRCNTVKSLSDFYFAKDSRLPRGGRHHSYCKKCMNSLHPVYFGQALLKKREVNAGRPRPEACEICNDSTEICWDHCHASGSFRGWICRRCNSTLGFVKDNSELLRKLADYLDKGREK